jgi:hypothetical protein
MVSKGTLPAWLKIRAGLGTLPAHNSVLAVPRWRATRGPSGDSACTAADGDLLHFRGRCLLCDRENLEGDSACACLLKVFLLDWIVLCSQSPVDKVANKLMYITFSRYVRGSQSPQEVAKPRGKVPGINQTAQVESSIPLRCIVINVHAESPIAASTLATRNSGGAPMPPPGVQSKSSLISAGTVPAVGR